MIHIDDTLLVRLGAAEGLRVVARGLELTQPGVPWMRKAPAAHLLWLAARVGYAPPLVLGTALSVIEPVFGYSAESGAVLEASAIVLREIYAGLRPPSEFGAIGTRADRLGAVAAAFGAAAQLAVATEHCLLGELAEMADAVLGALDWAWTAHEQNANAEFEFGDEKGAERHAEAAVRKQAVLARGLVHGSINFDELALAVEKYLADPEAFQPARHRAASVAPSAVPAGAGDASGEEPPDA